MEENTDAGAVVGLACDGRDHATALVEFNDRSPTIRLLRPVVLIRDAAASSPAATASTTTT